MEMNSIPWSPVLRYTTPLLPPVSTVALQHKSVLSVLRCATPLPINMTPVSIVGGPFPLFCGRPHPSRSTGPCSEHRRSVSSVLRYARPRFHRVFRPSPPDEHDHTFRSGPAGWLPMNTTMTLFLRSDPAMYTSPGRTYARVGVRDPARMYVHGRIFFLAHWSFYVRVHATCAPLLRHVHASTRTRARLYIDQYICTYTLATRMTTLCILRPGGSRLSGTSLRAKM